MDALTKKLMQEAGFESGSVGELLGLSEAQETLVEIKVRLTELLREERRARGWSQNRLAQAMGKKQQVVGRMEMAHRSVTLDLLLRALFTMGVELSRIARELEACEQHVAQVQNCVGELVQMGAIPNLVSRASVASQNMVSDSAQLLRLVRTAPKYETSHEARAVKARAVKIGSNSTCSTVEDDRGRLPEAA